MTTDLQPIAKLLEASTGWPARARSLQIVDSETFFTASEELKAVKALEAECDNSFNPIIEKANVAHKEAIKQKKLVREPLEQAEQIFKGSISGYTTRQEEQQRAERRRLEEEARLKFERDLEAQIETAEAEGASVAEVEAIIEQPKILPPVVVAVSVPKVSGVSTREIWSAQITDMWAFVQFVVKENRKDLLGLIQADSGAVNSLARSLKSALAVPGVKVEKRMTVASGRA